MLPFTFFVVLIFMPIDQNQNCIKSFFKDIHIWGKLPILVPKMMCHYFSASAVRMFLNVAHWKEPKGLHQNHVNGFPEIIQI